VLFSSSKNLIVKCIKFPHHNVHKYIWTSPGGITYNKIAYILIDERRQLHISDIHSLGMADCDNDHHTVVVIL
jgi:hypothetical protein